MITQGSVVKVHYTGKLENESVFDSSIDKSPLEFTVGQGQLIEGFENGVMGLSIGDKTTVKIEPNKGYGQIRQDLIMTVPKKNVPEDVKIGSQLQAESNTGQPVVFMVREVNDDNVIVDANHPLAGQTLIFDIEIVDVK